MYLWVYPQAVLYGVLKCKTPGVHAPEPPTTRTSGDCELRPDLTSIGVREGMQLGGRKKFALKITICPESNFFSLIRMGPETSCKSVLYSWIRYNGFVGNVNSPITLHFVRSRWHLLHAFRFACNVISAITFFMQSLEVLLKANSVVTLLVNSQEWCSLHGVFS